MKTTSRLLTVLPPVLLGLVLLVGWYSGTASGAVPAYQLPSIASVGSALWSGLTSGLFLGSAWVTLQESLGGFFIALLIGLPAGYGLARWWPFAVTHSAVSGGGPGDPGDRDCSVSGDLAGLWHGADACGSAAWSCFSHW